MILELFNLLHFPLSCEHSLFLVSKVLLCLHTNRLRQATGLQMIRRTQRSAFFYRLPQNISDVWVLVWLHCDTGCTLLRTALLMMLCHECAVDTSVAVGGKTVWSREGFWRASDMGGGSALPPDVHSGWMRMVYGEDLRC